MTSAPSLPRPPSAEPAPGPAGRGGRLRLGPAGRRRQPSLIALGVLLMVVAAGVVAAGYLRVGNRVPVLGLAETVEVGQPITDHALTTYRVAVDPAVQVIPATDHAQVIGQIATVTLPAGTLLAHAHLTDQPVPAPGLAKVGLLVRAGQLPAGGLVPGDRVMVIAAPPADAGAGAGAGASGGAQPGEVLVREARVYEQAELETADGAQVTLIVRQADAATVARYGAAGQAALVVLPANTGNGETGGTGR